MNVERSTISTLSSSFLEEIPTSCTPERALEKIQRLTTDKKICLFIGRTIHEPVPEEENAIWFSGDKFFGDLSRIPEPEKYLENRLHIVADFNNESQLAKLAGVFNKVVVDQSTTKFMEGNFIQRFARLLKISNDSVLIFEDYTKNPILIDEDDNGEANMIFGDMSIPQKIYTQNEEEQENLWIDYRKNTNSETQKEDEAKFRKSYTPCDDDAPEDAEKYFKDDFKYQIIASLQREKPTALDRVYADFKKQMLKDTETYFHSVELIQGKPFPYPTNYSGPFDNYIVARGVKGAESHIP